MDNNFIINLDSVIKLYDTEYQSDDLSFCVDVCLDQIKEKIMIKIRDIIKNREYPIIHYIGQGTYLIIDKDEKRSSECVNEQP